MTSSWTAPKSDQLNADDLIAGPRIIQIRKVVVKESGEQRCHIFYHGDNEKPWKPCKTMGRIMEEAWSIDYQKWIGKYVKVYRDPAAMFGGVKQGGIRIEGLSDIAADFETSVTISKGVRKPWKVKKIVVQQADAPAAVKAQTDMDPADIPDAGKEAASKGTAHYNAWCNARTANDKVHIKPLHPEWKKIAADVDAAAATNTGEPDPSVTG